MPRGDRTGPNGMGSMTGRGAGYCAGFSTPGFMNNTMPRMGLGRGGGFGRGFGRGWNRSFYPGPAVYGMPGVAPYSPESESENLEQNARMLQDQLDQINKRLTELKKESK